MATMTKGYSVLVSSKDMAREDRTGEFVDYVSLFEGEIATLDEATAVAFDVLHIAWITSELVVEHHRALNIIQPASAHQF